MKDKSYIDKKLKEFDEQIDGLMNWCLESEGGKHIEPNYSPSQLESFLKQALKDQREEILGRFPKKIDEVPTTNFNNRQRGEVVGFNQALSDCQKIVEGE